MIIVWDGSDDLINCSTASLQADTSSGNKWSFCYSPPFNKEISAFSYKISSLSHLIMIAGSAVSFLLATFSINATLHANSHVDNDSYTCSGSACMVAINFVLQFPPIESHSIIVIIEFQYGTWTDSPFFALLFNATIT